MPLTNEGLIRRFLLGEALKCQSYGFIADRHWLLSKTNTKMPIAGRLPEERILPGGVHYILATTDSPGLAIPIGVRHVRLLHQIANEMAIRTISAPQANWYLFPKYVEKQLFLKMSHLALTLRQFKREYNQLIKLFHHIEEGEKVLGLSKNQIRIPDSPVIQELWKWLFEPGISTKNDKEFLKKKFTLSQLFPSPPSL